MKKEVITCDIKGCSNTGANEIKMQTIFHTEQTEGRTVKPYFCTLKMDICDECLEKILTSGKYIHASGAMGNNEYRLVF